MKTVVLIVYVTYMRTELMSRRMRQPYVARKKFLDRGKQAG